MSSGRTFTPHPNQRFVEDKTPTAGHDSEELTKLYRFACAKNPKQWLISMDKTVKTEYSRKSFQARAGLA